MTYLTLNKIVNDILTVLLILLAMTIVSCEKDEDLGGYPSGTSGGGGGNDNDCNITCYNGGEETSNCNCDCPPGFIGNNCQTQLNPTGFTITKIKITEWPYYNGSNTWDTSSGADPRVEINLGMNPYLHTGTLPNPSSSVSLIYSTNNDPSNFPKSLDVGTTYDFKVYDDDNGSDDMMLNSYFSLSNYDTGLPDVITLSTSNGEWTFKIYGTWTF